MAEWTGKTRGGVAGYKAFVFVIKHFKIKAAYFLLRFVAFYFLIFTNKKPTVAYFRKIHHYSKLKTVTSIYKNYYRLGQVLIDKVAFMAGLGNSFSFIYEGEEFLHQMAEQKTGGILIGAHMGNWEVAGQLLERIDVKVNIVMLEAEHAKIKDYLDDVLTEKKMNIIPIKDDFSHLYRITEALQNKELVAIHGDRFLPGAQTVSVDFMGKPASFPTGPLYIASKNDVPVTFVYTVKDTDSQYHFYATPPKKYKYPSNLKTRKTEIKNMVEDYAQHLEKMVKAYPLQWFNYYHFWEKY